MSTGLWSGAFAVFFTALNLASIVAAAVRCRRISEPLAVPADGPPVSVVRPVCGLDNHVDETLGSTFALDYPAYEILFCVARADDPIVPVVRALIDAHPDRPARLLVGDERICANPKLNNVCKGWRAAQHEWIVLADSNVLMPRDYIQRLSSRWRADTGLVCSPPVGTRPANFWAELECAFLNTFQARWQFVAESAGLGFAQGKSMLFRRDIVDAGGGIRMLGAELAEDAATTKLVHAAGLRVRLVDNAFEQPLGRRSARQVWARQARWAKLRRLTFPAFYLPEILSGAALPTLAAAYAAAEYGVNVAATVGILWSVWYGAEALLARVVGWHLSARLPFAFMVRDLMLPALWIYAWLSNDFEWRGTAMTTRSSAAEAVPARTNTAA
jgi:ceramide glucosyltransferase